MTEAQLTEFELAANAHPGNRSAGMILALVAEVRRLQKRSAKRSGFVPPTVDEVEEFFAEGEVFKNGTARAKAEEWHDFYTSKGFMVGRSRMVDWRSSARLWEARAKATAAPALGRISPEPRM